MNNRLKIPGLALLTLSLTDCVDRNGPDQDPIVGDWHAIMVDDQMAPVIMNEDGETIEVGVELRVTADLQGTLLYSIDFDYDGYLGGYEQGSTLVVDAGAAPEYRIDVKHDFFEVDIGSEPYSSSDITGSYGSSGYEPDTSTGSYGGELDESDERPLRIPLDAELAAPGIVLRCTLAAKRLNCERDGDETPNILVFERDADE